MSDNIELADFIEDLRRELSEALARGHGKDVRFATESVDLELTLAVEKSAEANGKISFKIFSSGAELGGGGGLTATNTQKLSLKLTPVDRDGEQLFVRDRSGGSA